MKELYIAKNFSELQDKAYFKYDKLNNAKYNLNFAKRAFLQATEAYIAVDKKDEERAYVLYMKYIDAMTQLQKTPYFKRKPEEFKQLANKKDLLTALNRSEELNKSLKKRYTEREVKLKPETKESKTSSLNESSQEQVIKDPFENLNVHIETNDFYRLVFKLKLNILIIDIRNNDDFLSSSLKHAISVNVPESVITPGTTTSKLEKSIKNEYFEKWKKRDSYDLIIMMDWFGDKNCLEGKANPMRSLKDSLWKWELSKKLKREPLFLVGGFYEFLDCFPQFVTDHRIKPPFKSKENSKPVNSLIDFEYAALNKYINKEKVPEKGRTSNDEKTAQLNITGLKLNEVDIKTVKKDSITEKQNENSIIKSNNSSTIPSIDRSIKPSNKMELSSNPTVENSYKDKGMLLNKEINNSKNQTKLLEEQTAEIELKLQILKQSEDEKKKKFLIKKEKEQELLEKMRQIKNNSVPDNVFIKPTNPKVSYKEDVSIEPNETKTSLRYPTDDSNNNLNLSSLEVDKLVKTKEKNGSVIANVPQIPKLDRSKKPSLINESSSEESLKNKSIGINDKFIADSSVEPKIKNLEISSSKETEFNNQIVGNNNKVSLTPKRSSSLSRPTKSITNTPNIPNRSSKPVSIDSSNNSFIMALNKSLSGVYGNTEKGVCGLRNLGNTCFMNSILQCMFNTVELADYFINNAYKKDLNRVNVLGKGGKFAECFSVLLRGAWSGQYKYLIPKDFKFWAGKVNEMFQDYQQQDAQEFLMTLIDGLHEDLNKSPKNKKLVEEDNDKLNDTEAAKLAMENHYKLNQSELHNLFLGQFKAVVTCLHCKRTSRKFDMFLNLSLQLPERTCTLSELLSDFEKPEKMVGENKWHCPTCKTKREALKVIKIWRLPPILVIHFKRFKTDGKWKQKVHTNIKFPLSNLSMNRFVEGPSKVNNYNLYAVSYHKGNGMDSGHYTASCRSIIDEKWYNFDDTDVSRINGPDVSSAFVLFYSNLERSTYRQSRLNTSVASILS